MASFGANKPMFAPFSGTEPTNALPKYGKSKSLGKLVSANVTVNMANGELYADDSLAENVTEFISASIAMETDDITDEVKRVVYGNAADATGSPTGELKYNIADAAPLGGLCYYKALMVGGVKTYEGYYYPKVKAALGNDNAQTKGSSITFGTTSTTFTVFAAATGDWRFTKRCATETEVIAWMEEKLQEATE